jgi:hypothetical protein
MERVNIYLSDEQLMALRGLAERQSKPVAELVRQAINDWLKGQGVRTVAPNEWEQRFDALLEERRGIAKKRNFAKDDVERDVLAAVREVRKARAARRR